MAAESTAAQGSRRVIASRSRCDHATLAEAMSNARAFLVPPNHTADDFYRFSCNYHRTEKFYVTHVVGSANDRCADDLTDLMSLWLNYQTEHHLIPKLPMRRYRRMRPQVKTLCDKHGNPHRQEYVFQRFGRMLDVAVGRTSMRELEAFPRGAGGQRQVGFNGSPRRGHSGFRRYRRRHLPVAGRAKPTLPLHV